jgi:hypothetical protein
MVTDNPRAKATNLAASDESVNDTATTEDASSIFDNLTAALDPQIVSGITEP